MRDGKADWWDGLTPRWVAAITIVGYGVAGWLFREPLMMIWERFGYWSFIPVLAVIGLALIPLGPIALAVAVVAAIGFVLGHVGIAAAILVCLFLLSRK